MRSGLLFCFTGLSKGVFLQELIKAKMLKQKRDLIDRRIVIASLTDSGRGTLKKTDEYQKKGNGEDTDEPQSRGNE